MEGIISTPVLGEVKDITTCSDNVFAEKMLGDGVLITPNNNTIVSPCNGKVFSIMKSKHAITLVSDEGIELLIHIGIDTVELAGEGFKSLIVDNQDVKKGQELVQVDFDFIKEQGYDPSVLLIILSKDCVVEKKHLNNYIKKYDDILICEKK